jgi:hypothetical protein
MIKIGILGINDQSVKWVHSLNMIDDVELDCCYDNDCSVSNQFAQFNGIHSYSYIDEFLNKVDAVCINNTQANIDLVSLCLKNFKHVFLNDVQNINYCDLQNLIKISEESGAQFYPDFNSRGAFIRSKINTFPDFDAFYIDLRFALGKNFSSPDHVNSIIFQNINIALEIFRSQYKNVFVHGWNYHQDYFGTLSIRIEFNNGGIANLLIHESNGKDFIHIDLYSSAHILRLEMCENLFTCKAENIVKGISSSFNEKYDNNEFLLTNLKYFVGAINGNSNSVKDKDNKDKTIHLGYTVLEKISSIIPSHIFNG